MKKENTVVETIIGAIIAFVSLTIFMFGAYVVKPAVLFSGRMLWKGLKKAGSASWARLTTRKVKSAPVQLKTPDIFKGMPNLAPAKEMRF